jgi:hypothetical protein
MRWRGQRAAASGAGSGAPTPARASQPPADTGGGGGRSRRRRRASAQSAPRAPRRAHGRTRGAGGQRAQTVLAVLCGVRWEKCQLGDEVVPHGRPRVGPPSPGAFALSRACARHPSGRGRDRAHEQGLPTNKRPRASGKASAAQRTAEAARKGIPDSGLAGGASLVSERSSTGSMADDAAAAAQYQPTAEELVAAIKEVKEKNPDFGIKRVYNELKVCPQARADRARDPGPLPPGGCGCARGGLRCACRAGLRARVCFRRRRVCPAPPAA